MMLKNKIIVKAMALVAISIVFVTVQSCGDTGNTTENSDVLVAEASLGEHDAEPHGHSHSPQSDAGKRIMAPDGAQQLWIFPESADKLGSGGLMEIYMDPESHPEASSGFAKYELGVGGALPEHKHNKTEEIAYFLSGKGIIVSYVNDKRKETEIKEGYVWYTAPGEWHSFQNTGDEPLKLVFATIPNAKHGLLTFFKKVGAEPGKQGAAISPEEFAKLATDNDLILKPAKVD